MAINMIVQKRQREGNMNDLFIVISILDIYVFFEVNYNYLGKDNETF